jgi:ferredoxin
MEPSGKAQREKPVPQIDSMRCDGCGCCVRICPTKALSLEGGIAVVIDPQRCDYLGYCELACEAGAIRRAFEVIDGGETEAGRSRQGREGD